MSAALRELIDHYTVLEDDRLERLAGFCPCAIGSRYASLCVRWPRARARARQMRSRSRAERRSAKSGNDPGDDPDRSHKSIGNFDASSPAAAGLFARVE